jgi:hypothetical protein
LKKKKGDSKEECANKDSCEKVRRKGKQIEEEKG